MSAAFPGVRVVTASVGDKIEEREFPVNAHIILGKAAGDADFSVHHADLHAKPYKSTTKNLTENHEVENVTQHAWVISPGTLALKTASYLSIIFRTDISENADIGNPGSRYFGV